MKDYIVKELEQRISSFQQLPYLFVGTGFSMRYSHAPSWNTLLFDIWTVINPTKKERDFNKLKQPKTALKLHQKVQSCFFVDAIMG